MLVTKETHDFLWQWLPLSASWSCHWQRCRNRNFLIQPGNSILVGFLERFQFGIINFCRLWAYQRQSTSVPGKNIWYILWSCWTFGLWDCLLKKKIKELIEGIMGGKVIDDFPRLFPRLQLQCLLVSCPLIGCPRVLKYPEHWETSSLSLVIVLDLSLFCKEILWHKLTVCRWMNKRQILILGTYLSY